MKSGPFNYTDYTHRRRSSVGVECCQFRSKPVVRRGGRPRPGADQSQEWSREVPDSLQQQHYATCQINCMRCLKNLGRDGMGMCGHKGPWVWEHARTFDVCTWCRCCSPQIGHLVRPGMWSRRPSFACCMASRPAKADIAAPRRPVSRPGSLAT